VNGRQWVQITPRGNIPLREGRAVTLGDREIAIFNLGDRFLATDNRCPHRGGPLCDGIVAGESVVCPLHAWKVRLDTGAVERPAAHDKCVATYPTRVDNGIVLIELPLAALEAPEKGEKTDFTRSNGGAETHGAPVTALRAHG
jgi:nitrite reductase (NADH) small subunit